MNENLIGNSKEMTDFLGNHYQYNCLGCELSSKKIVPPGGIIYEDDTFILASDPEIPLNGFLIVNVKRHIHSIIELSLDEQHRLIEIISKSISILKDLKITEEVTIIQEERSRHFHVWLFPNQDWMTEKFGKGVSYVRDICEYLRNNATSEEKKEVLETIDKIKERYH